MHRARRPGGAFLAWYDLDEIRAQHVDGSGVRQWAANGVLLNDSSPPSQYGLRGAGDGRGMAIFAWEDGRDYGATGKDLFAQRLTAGGPTWTAGGVAISQACGDQRDPAIGFSRQGAAVIAWVDARSGSTTPDIYALQVLDGPIFSGPLNGLPVSTAAYGQWQPVVGASGLGDAVLVWKDSRNPPTGSDVYAQAVFVTVLFADGFEAGDVTAWDRSVP